MTVVCLGEALIDLTPGHGSSLIDADALAVSFGGAPLNVAIHLKRAGIESRFLGTLSSDGFGDRIRALLKRENVAHTPVNPVDAPTRLAVIDHQNDAQPFKFYGDRPADTLLTVEDVDEALTPDVTALYVTSLLMTNPKAARVQRAAIQQIRERGDTLVVSDPNPRPSAWSSRAAMVDAVETLLRVSHVTKLSLDDARTLDWPADPQQLMAHLMRRTSGAVVITDGKQGSWFEGDSDVQHVPAPPVVEIDPTGAGDAFFAAVIDGFLRHAQLNQDSLRSASEAGAAVAARHGAL